MMTCQHCLPAPPVPVCPMLLIQAEGSHVGTQGTLCVQGDAPRDPGGLAVHVGHSHTDLLTVLGEEGYVLGFGTRINKVVRSSSGGLSMTGVLVHCRIYLLATMIPGQLLCICTWASSDEGEKLRLSLFHATPSSAHQGRLPPGNDKACTLAHPSPDTSPSLQQTPPPNPASRRWVGRHTDQDPGNFLPEKH